MSELMHESEHPWEGACLLTSEGEQIVVLAADCPVCRAERSEVYVVWLEQAMRSAIRWLECFPEKGNSDAAEQAREELRDALKKAL